MPPKNFTNGRKAHAGIVHNGLGDKWKETFTLFKKRQLIASYGLKRVVGHRIVLTATCQAAASELDGEEAGCPPVFLRGRKSARNMLLH